MSWGVAHQQPFVMKYIPTQYTRFIHILYLLVSFSTVYVRRRERAYAGLNETQRGRKFCFVSKAAKVVIARYDSIDVDEVQRPRLKFMYTAHSKWFCNDISALRERNICRFNSLSWARTFAVDVDSLWDRAGGSIRSILDSI